MKTRKYVYFVRKKEAFSPYLRTIEYPFSEEFVVVFDCFHRCDSMIEFYAVFAKPFKDRLACRGG